MHISEQDWKLFRKKLPAWQEAYINRINQEYIALLRESGNASEKFWKLEKRTEADKRHPGVILEMRRQNMVWALSALLNAKVISNADLSEFSEELRAFLSHSPKQGV